MAATETPSQYLESHYLTRELARLGVTDEQLQGMRFRSSNQDRPFSRWSYTWLGKIPSQVIPLVKAYCALKWLVLENPSYSRDKEDAWQLVAETMAAPTLAIGERARDAQSKRAKRPRGKITDDGETIDQVIQKLAVNPQYRRDTAKELWTRFWHLLMEKELDPKEIEDPENAEKQTYAYDFKNGRKEMTFRRFQCVVSKARRREEKNRVNRANDISSIESLL
ncbi:MAG: hypothetical protein WAN65_11485 [Candidatus Sulfotelmatobacter sp.]